MKQGYKAIIHLQQWNLVEIPLKLCWDATCLPKASFFLCLVLQNRFLTMDRLSRFGIIDPQWCVLCKHSSEDVDNIFLNCPFTLFCWEWLQNRLGWSNPFQSSLKGLLCSWPMDLDHGVYSKLWNIFPSIVVWELWKERNCYIFKNKELVIDRFLLKLETSIVEVLNANLRKK